MELYNLAFNGDFERVKKLLYCHSEIGDWGFNGACAGGHKEIVLYFINDLQFLDVKNGFFTAAKPTASAVATSIPVAFPGENRVRSPMQSSNLSVQFLWSLKSMPSVSSTTTLSGPKSLRISSIISSVILSSPA